MTLYIHTQVGCDWGIHLDRRKTLTYLFHRLTIIYCKFYKTINYRGTSRKCHVFLVISSTGEINVHCLFAERREKEDNEFCDKWITVLFLFVVLMLICCK